jgi:hypothetical protein
MPIYHLPLHFYRESIPPGTSRFWVDLSWNPARQPYALHVWSPDGALGPYLNTANGVQDSRIFLEISAGSNLTAGDWYYAVQETGAGPETGFAFRTYRDAAAGQS